ncbi:MAG: YihA family ribosome biogenesis GTP-binding protein [Cryomorphaceae bacterium]|jgi:GTP-binding protein|nr:YihA family ribosome biogenesis GTP-binding protein [Cryomorphaceae bacterium]MDG1889185.1 ribosome biogenesis GTP-binding protein YihA/YsxC [Flavobacteriaceae bacterium]MBT3503305.1 YihA family ribosome biogenesis GTP-binding protein [Cryomorphaceae bacterium]MBT3689673.1 YihA family ribosome biogenesis GTP-binding protein [Cryomorphaceae bacterium]MBT4221768.1 YihA family ribosome biogenesis GTP-binding protein [Cryomorphaceae bacterium]|tara:strand:+ start:514 stop:1116 length:603 start_codon:yes stop_codon:yes gene_type:complete
MKIINSVFEKSSKTVNQCPNNNLPEFALVGRSNVGKSSLINSLLNNKSIAKISSKPGKTLLINHFRINDKLYIVDLPGYGYASISKKIKEDIKTIHKSYFKSRKELLYTLLLIDIRHDIQENDIEFMEFLSSNYCPFIIIFTKSDKLKINKLDEQIQNLKKQLSDYWEDFPKMFVTSSKDKTGIDEIHSFIESSLKEYII